MISKECYRNVAKRIPCISHCNKKRAIQPKNKSPHRPCSTNFPQHRKYFTALTESGVRFTAVYCLCISPFIVVTYKNNSSSPPNHQYITAIYDIPKRQKSTCKSVQLLGCISKTSSTFYVFILISYNPPTIKHNILLSKVPKHFR